MENDKVIQKIGKWAQYTQDPKAVVFDELDAISDKLDEVLKTLEPLDFSESDTIKGETGYSPQRGVDFLTDEELEEIKEEILAKATPQKGEHYFTDEELQEIINHVTPRKGEHYDDGLDGVDGMTPDIEEIKKLIVSDEEFISKLKGKDGDNTDITGEYIAEELNKTTASIDFKVIKGLSEKLMQQKSDIPASIRIRAKIAGVEQNEPIGSINFPSGTTHTGMDYTVAGGGSTVTVGTGVLTASDYVTTFTPTLTPVAGSLIVFIPDANSVDNATLNGANIKEVTDTGLNNIEKDDFIAGAFYELRYNGTNWVVEGSINKTIQAWTASSNYDAGQLLSVGTRIVQRTLSGTSGLAFDSTEAALYTIVKPIDENIWVASTYYYANETVIYNGYEYIRNTSGTSGIAFDGTESLLWTSLLNAGVAIATDTTFYQASQFALVSGEQNRLVRRIADGISTDMTDPVEHALWEGIGVARRGNYSAGKYYWKGDIVTTQGKTYLCTTSHVTTTVMNTTENNFWTAIPGAGLQTLTVNRFYETNEMVTEFTRPLRRTAEGTSAAVTDNTERALWSSVGTYFTGTWVTGKFYWAQDLVLRNGNMYQKFSIGASAASWELDGGNWTLLSAVNQTWTPLEYYHIGSIVNNNGITYVKTLTAGPAAATFTPIEAAKWKVIGTYSTDATIATQVKNASWTVTEVDEFTNNNAGSIMVVTLPSTLPDGKVFTFIGTISGAPANTITFTAGAGTTIISPTTYLPVASFTMPGTAGQHFGLRVVKFSNVWELV